MARNLTAGTLAELAKSTVKPVIFVEAEFVSGIINVWSGVGQISWDGKSWTGLGRFGGVSAVPESTEVEAQGIVLSLSGIPSDLISKALNDVRPNKPVKIWFGFLNASDAVIADPYLSFSGTMDTPEIDEGGETSTIRIHAESRLVDFNRPRERRWTHEDQQIDYPGDKGFEYVASLQDWNGVWGKAGPTGGGSIPTQTPMAPSHAPLGGPYGPGRFGGPSGNRP